MLYRKQRIVKKLESILFFADFLVFSHDRIFTICGCGRIGQLAFDAFHLSCCLLFVTRWSFDNQHSIFFFLFISFYVIVFLVVVVFGLFKQKRGKSLFLIGKRKIKATIQFNSVSTWICSLCKCFFKFFNCCKTSLLDVFDFTDA